MPGQGQDGPRVHVDSDAIVAAFKGGASVNSLATKHGVSTGTIERRLAARGLKPRSRAEENRRRLQSLTPEQGRSLTGAAVAASVKSRRKTTVQGVRVSVMMSRELLDEIDASLDGEYRQDWIREAIRRRLRSRRQNQ